MEEKPLSTLELLRLYDEKRDVYQGFCETVTNLIKRLIEARSLVVHSISSRCKGRASLEGKVKKKPKYKSLSEITDLAGVRVITHYSDDVDLVSKIIEEEFDVDTANSIDKQKALDPDRFGYLSRHYVVSLLATRSQLKEYAIYRDMKVEIQVRTVLQHAWAEIEHDIGYKIKVEVPDPIKRRFSRLAGLLELADQEFISIRDDNLIYAESVEASRAAGYSGIGLDAVSIQKFVESDPLNRRIFDEMLVLLDGVEGADNDASSALVHLSSLGVRTVSELHDQLSFHEKDLILLIVKMLDDPSLAAEFTTRDGERVVSLAIPIFMLGHILVAMQGPDKVLEYLRSNGWDKTDADEVFKNIMLGFCAGHN
ncbi:hypothetical protein [Pseudomonas syringae]|nr:hypothetical protein [Pseudomonas syringae]